MKERFIVYLILILFTFCLLFGCHKIYSCIKTDEFPLDPVFYENFFNDDEINLLLNSCTDFKPSNVRRDGGKIEPAKDRTSKTCFIELSNSKVYDLIKGKIKKKFGLDCKIEKLQMTKYNGGEFYNKHYDYFKDLPKGEPQRVKTIFAYLKEPLQGGETEFPKINKKFKPSKGGAVVWTNCIKKNDGYEFRENSLHAGNPVRKGEKIGLNIWIIE